MGDCFGLDIVRGKKFLWMRLACILHSLLRTNIPTLLTTLENHMTLSTVLMLMFACGDKSNDTASDDTSTPDNAYSFHGLDFVFQRAEGFELIGDSFNISFPEDSFEMRFGAGCNSHFGEYEVVDGVFQMLGMGATEIGCDTSLMEQDSWLASFFTSSPTVDHDGDTITFSGEAATLVFVDEDVAIPDQPLQDIKWEIGSYFDGEIATSYSLDVLPNFLFSSDGTFTTNMGCNGASGTYVDNNGTLDIAIDAITDAICEGDLNTIEGHIFNVISNTPKYEIEGNSITLMAGDLGIGAVATAE